MAELFSPIIGKLRISAMDALSPIDVGGNLYRLTDRLYRAQNMRDVYEAALDAITESLDCSRASVLLFDDANVMRFVAWRGLSDGYRKALEGHTPWSPDDVDPPPIFVSDIDETGEAQKVKDVIKGEGIRSLGFVPLIASGQVIGKFMTYYAAPRTFSQAEQDLAVTIARQVGFSFERRRTEAARELATSQLQESEERFRIMAESAPVMMWVSDDQGACQHLNRCLREFWGVTGPVSDFDWRETMHEEDAPSIVEKMTHALVTRSNVLIKGRYKSTSGEYRVLETDARPRFSAAGTFLGMVGVNSDITDRERAESHRDLLVRELDHRVKNTLAVVQGIAHQTFRASKTLDEAKTSFDGRLLALSAAHDLLIRGSWAFVELSALTARMLDTDKSNKGRIRVDGPGVKLSPKHTLVAALVLQELFTNAVKYGALSSDTGIVTFEWEQLPADQLRAVWIERGGPTVSTPDPARKGFGSVLLSRTLADVGGTIETDFQPAGVICHFTMKTSP